LRRSIDQRSALRQRTLRTCVNPGASVSFEKALGRVFPWKPYPFATLFPGVWRFIKGVAPALISAVGALKTKGGGLKER
jgi:hypothetical protein